MSRSFLFAVWAASAWIAPAAIAGGLGWKGIWGSGSAFVDYIIPIPVAGGVLHLPSFALVSVIVFTQPWRVLGGYARGILLAGALIGVATLLDLDRLQLAATTDAAVGSLWQQQPLGLFILSDCVIAQLFIGALEGRWPVAARELIGSLAIALVVPALYASASLQADPRQKNPFVHTGSRPGEQRADNMVFYYSKLPLGSDAFRKAAAEVVSRHDPRSNINDEDIAIYFYDNLVAAQSRRAENAKYTVCLHQDGTPTGWSPGSYDCFEGHVTFTELMEKAYARQDKRLPQDVRAFLAARVVCRSRKPLEPLPDIPLDNQEVRSCDPQRAERARDDLLRKFVVDPLSVAVLKP